MSCDICHAAKIKCGSQKPSCRRCSVKQLDCVYSVSHRKGRPREKRKGPENGEASRVPLPEPTQGPDVWTPVTTNFELPVMSDSSEAASSQPSGDSLTFPAVSSPFEMDNSFGFPTMLGSIEDSTMSDDRQANMIGYTDQVENTNLLSPAMMEMSAQDLFCFVDTESLLQQDNSGNSSVRSAGIQSDKFPQSDFTSILENVSSLNQTLGSGLDFLQNAPQDQRRERGAVSRNPTYPSPSDDFPFFFEDGARKDLSRANCECFSALLRRIRGLKSKQKSRGLIPIGSVLVMERETNECLSRLHRCKSCGQDSIAYLFAMVSVRIVLDLMQKTVHDEFMTGTRRASQSSGTSRSRLASEPSPESSSLYIGNFKVPARAKRRYLREMLQARFSKFLVLVEEREKLVHGVGQDCFAEGASALMGNIARDVKTILGWVELWSAKD